MVATPEERMLANETAIAEMRKDIIADKTAIAGLQLEIAQLKMEKEEMKTDILENNNLAVESDTDHVHRMDRIRKTIKIIKRKVPMI